MLDLHVAERSIIGPLIRAESGPRLWTIGVGGIAVFAGIHAMVRSQRGLWSADMPTARWAARISSTSVTTAAKYITYVGSTAGVITAAVAVAAVEYRRGYGRSVAGYLTVVFVTEAGLVNIIKSWLGRGRPQISVLAKTVSSSFPSGHTTAAAALYACVAVVGGRGRSKTIRLVLQVGAGAVAAAVGSTRIILGVHWLSDVLAGLALGWAIAAFGTLAFLKQLAGVWTQ
jgi:membrane-associated phospholipid phosphatase